MDRVSPGEREARSTKILARTCDIAYMMLAATSLSASVTPLRSYNDLLALGKVCPAVGPDFEGVMTLEAALGRTSGQHTCRSEEIPSAYLLGELLDGLLDRLGC